MSDVGYGPKVYHRQGGDDLVIASGGRLIVDAGAVIQNAGGMTRRTILTGTNLVLTAADSGAVVICTAADVKVTLPSTALGLFFTIVTGVASGGTGVQVDPAAADQIIGAGFTPADNKDAINTGATDVVGDAITVVGDGAAGWYVTDVVGIWARE